MRDHKNPGTTNPADQAFPACITPQTPATPSSASTTNSTGEQQLPSRLAVWAKPVPGRGLPAEVHAGHSSHVRSSRPAIAATRPPAKDVHAGNSRPGGLPKNVNIK